MPDFGIFRGFNEKLFGDKLYAGQLPTQLGLIGSEDFSFLLDTYPTAAAAYSLRKLRTAYTGSAIRVRRASDNSEQDIGFVNNQLDTSTLTSFCSGTNGFVKTWYDQSGNGNNATQSTANYQLQIFSSGSTITENGNPAMQGGIDKGFAINFMNSGSNWSVGFVAKLNDYSLLFDNNSSDPQDFWMIPSSTSTGIEGISNVTLYQNNTLRTDSRRNALSTYFNNIYSLGFYYGAINPTTPSYQVDRLGNANKGRGIVGTIQEIIIWNSDQSSNRTNIETNINNFYSIY